MMEVSFPLFFQGLDHTIHSFPTTPTLVLSSFPLPPRVATALTKIYAADCLPLKNIQCHLLSSWAPYNCVFCLLQFSYNKRGGSKKKEGTKSKRKSPCDEGVRCFNPRSGFNKWLLFSNHFKALQFLLKRRCMSPGTPPAAFLPGFVIWKESPGVPTDHQD